MCHLAGLCKITVFEPQQSDSAKVNCLNTSPPGMDALRGDLTLTVRFPENPSVRAPWAGAVTPELGGMDPPCIQARRKRMKKNVFRIDFNRWRLSSGQPLMTYPQLKFLITLCRVRIRLRGYFTGLESDQERFCVQGVSVS